MVFICFYSICCFHVGVQENLENLETKVLRWRHVGVQENLENLKKQDSQVAPRRGL